MSTDRGKGHLGADIYPSDYSSLTDVSIPHTGHVLAVDDQGYVLCQYPVTRTVRTDSGTMPYTFHQYTLLGPDFSVLLDNIDEYYNVGQYDYSCDSELFYNGLVAVRVGATDWYLPDGGPWPRLYFNSKYMFIDRSGKIVSNARYDEVSNENDRWFGCHGRPSICWTATEMSANRRITAMFPALGLKI